MKSGRKVLPLVGAGSVLLAHLLSAAAFRRRTDAMIACLEETSEAELSTTPVPSVVQSFARRAVCENPVPNTVWLSQRGELRLNPRAPWRPFTAEQVISVHQPGFAWLAQMQAAPFVPLRVLDCYVDGAGLLEARLFGSLRLARAAGPQAGKGELMPTSPNSHGRRTPCCTIRSCPGAKSMRPPSKYRPRARPARHGCG